MSLIFDEQCSDLYPPEEIVAESEDGLINQVFFLIFLPKIKVYIVVIFCVIANTSPLQDCNHFTYELFFI